ncbi:hypothetical protein TREMEDRAFT_69380 [Tremella mesenterica DSM 1558]|uniref:uncharacterized protein n=1 Tax=Tremella mesenterica (strain ATCC 24925 / CBS 8224 / DSM 1558 / NBRC 9311 / NRRL Y-6157 / RJB 2259-6 / UBC 559-6) TaxID=578456 RepID=UPI0003F4A098|nr:uncharacterized protein TREMEDRAFT_69380 [Tremella mesenterica DSM 1558]EIW68456.1 hypothetical protein TREMEDRAFT_69380 [Tremella mesenterica DSM 1558]
MSQAGPSKASHHLSSGALSGFTSAVCLQPLDLLKTRLQQNYEDGRRRKIVDTVKVVLKDDGIFGLWRGTTPTLIRNVPGVAIYFYTLSSIRTHLSSLPYFSITNSDRSGFNPSPTNSARSALVRLSSQGNLIAGAIARTGVGFVLNPVTIIKARYESTKYGEYNSVLGAARSLWGTSGVRGLFQGVTATAARDAPYAGLYLVFYEKGKDITGRLIRPEWNVPNAALHSASGALAAVAATVMTSPADCVKTRMQVDPVGHGTLRGAIRRIYSDRGLLGFFSGSSLRISRKAASSAIAWTVYEAVLIFLRDHPAGFT